MAKDDDSRTGYGPGQSYTKRRADLNKSKGNHYVSCRNNWIWQLQANPSNLDALYFKKG